MRYPIERVSDNWERRIIKNGYVQHREVYRNGTHGEWQFYVSGFGPTVEVGTGRCTVLKEGGSYDRTVPIDADNRIKINGRWYDRRYWDH
ncbi:MAG: hypothetical protein M0T70_12430 [Geobacteraceae bacterium]|jgi:hypothetical protein|nr:hypothetical protein [Geobacteraceae bacterium]